MSERKKRQPGRPSLPDEEKRSRNLTFRSRGDLRDRLSDAASKNGRSISEEIESRLEASYTKDERIEELKGRLSELRQRADAAQAEYQKDRNDLFKEHERARQEIEEFRAEHNKRYAEIEAEFESEKSRLKAAEAIFDALVGDDFPSREALRSIALFLAGNRGWASSSDGMQRATDAAKGAIQAAANRETRQ